MNERLFSTLPELITNNKYNQKLNYTNPPPHLIEPKFKASILPNFNSHISTYQNGHSPPSYL